MKRAHPATLIPVLAAIIWLALLRPAHASSIDGTLSLDTSGLVGNAAGPFELAFVLIDGSGINDANNILTVSNFSFGGGSAGAVDTLLSGGGVSGDIVSGVTLIDSSFLNLFAFSFTPGSSLAFDFDFTTNVDAGFTPDTWSLVLLQGDGSAVNTSDPSGASSLLTVNIDSANPSILGFASDLTPAPTLSTTVPEPPSPLLIAAGLFGAMYTVRRKREGRARRFYTARRNDPRVFTIPLLAPGGRAKNPPGSARS